MYPKRDNMEQLDNWYKQAVHIVGKHITSLNKEFIIYKGFKITKHEEQSFTIEDVRFSNMYGKVSDRNLEILSEKGFIAGVDYIGYLRDNVRVKSLKKSLETLYTKRRKYKKEFDNDPKLNEKRIRSINKKIPRYVFLMGFYQTRVNQFNIKYNKNE